MNDRAPLGAKAGGHRHLRLVEPPPADPPLQGGRSPRSWALAYVLGGALVVDAALVFTALVAWALFGGAAVRAAVDWRLGLNPLVSLGVSASSVAGLLWFRRWRRGRCA